MKSTNLHLTSHTGRIRRLLTALLALSVLVATLGSATASAQDVAPAADPEPAQYFPFITSNTWRTDLGDRVGFNAVAGDIATYGDIRTLSAGWYNDWRVDPSPNRLNGIEYVQTIRVHMKLACGDFYHYDRTACPYATPHTYVFTPNEATIRLAAKLNVGSLWVIGNEIDRKDWCEELSGNTCIKSGGQDEMLPEIYARAYHDLRAIIKDADSTALIANGGIIQPTPLDLSDQDLGHLPVALRHAHAGRRLEHPQLHSSRAARFWGRYPSGQQRNGWEIHGGQSDARQISRQEVLHRAVAGDAQVDAGARPAGQTPGHHRIRAVVHNAG
jgi:hypothetical protein